MTPYYSDEAVTLYHGDADDLLPIAADVTITDPPYGFGAYASDREADVATLRHALTSRTTAIFGYPELLVRWCSAVGEFPDEWVTWWPTNAMRGRDKHLQRESECVAIFGEIPGSRELRRPRSANSARLASDGFTTSTDALSVRIGDVWRDPRPGVAFNSHLRLHPNEKPLDLMRRLVVLCSREGETVLDPYAGSGTTLVAAKQLGRRAIGVEIEERYCEVAAERLRQDVLDFGAA